MAPSMPALTPALSWSTPQTASTSFLVTKQTALPTILRRVSPIPIGLTPGHLSRAINRFETRALISSQGVLVFASLRARAATASLSFPLCAP